MLASPSPRPRLFIHVISSSAEPLPRRSHRRGAAGAPRRRPGARTFSDSRRRPLRSAVRLLRASPPLRVGGAERRLRPRARRQPAARQRRARPRRCSGRRSSRGASVWPAPVIRRPRRIAPQAESPGRHRHRHQGAPAAPPAAAPTATAAATRPPPRRRRRSRSPPRSPPTTTPLHRGRVRSRRSRAASRLCAPHALPSTVHPRHGDAGGRGEERPERGSESSAPPRAGSGGPRGPREATPTHGVTMKPVIVR